MKHSDKLNVKKAVRSYQAKTNQNKAGRAILVLDKINSEQIELSRIKRTLQNDKGVNSPRRHNNPKRVCT